jgi:hypothetical protein
VWYIGDTKEVCQLAIPKVKKFNMADYKLIIKYIKVRALAQRGKAGERDNARRMLRKLEMENPSLKSQVAAFERKQPNDNSPPGVTPKYSRQNGNVWQNLGNWENIFQYAQSAVHTAYGFAEAWSHAQQGSWLAENIELKTELTRKGEVHISFVITPSIYRDIASLDESQKSVLKSALQKQLGAELTRLLG